MKDYLIINTEIKHDARLLENYGIDDLNIKTLAKYKDYLIRQNLNERYIDCSYNEMLLEIGAIRKDRKDGEEKLTLGGLLFFGKYNSIVEILPHFHLDYQNKINDPICWTDRVSTGDVDDIDIFEFYVLVLEKLKATVLDSFSLSEDLTRRSISSDIEISLCEALANALIHADYEYNMPVIVEAHKAHCAFKNPGHMKITLEEFARGGKSVPRNNVIITLFRRIGVCERAGTGGPQIYSSAQKNRLRFPDIVSDEFSTSLILWKTDIADSYPEITGDARLVMKLLQRSISPLSSSDIRECTGLSKHFLMKAINELLETELIYRDDTDSSIKYALKQSSQK